MPTIVYELDREESFGTDGINITRTLRVVPYSARLDVIQALMGGVSIIGGSLVRTAPLRDPWYPWAWCVDAKATPFESLNSPENVPGGLNILRAKNYSESAKIVATYKTPDPNQPDQPTTDTQSNNDTQEKEIAAEGWDFSAENLTLPNNYWKFSSDSVLLAKNNIAVTKTIPKVEYTLIRHFCLKIPYTAITGLMGRINKSNFKTPRFTWLPEMMRFDGAHVSRKWTNKGAPWYEITYRFAVRCIYDFIDSLNPLDRNYVGWNRGFRSDKSWWEYPVAVADPSRKIYQDDEDISQTFGATTVQGFALLFHPAAH